MVGRPLKPKSFFTIGASVLVIASLAACDEIGALGFGGGDTADDVAGDAAAPVASTDTSNAGGRDVEAPDVFQVTEPGLWDGRPSLGGVWVAHPDVADPERVIIRNDANGKSVIGALFRRERENPGPALQVSSDAATELGMLAGSPATLNVTALRRDETPAAVATAVSSFDETPEVTAQVLDPVADDAIAGAAVAAIDAVVTAAAPSQLSSSLDRPFVQIGIFSVEANANRTAQRLSADGLPARILAQQSQGRSFWRVIVGPAPNAADRAVILEKVKALGFSDAYFVTN